MVLANDGPDNTVHLRITADPEDLPRVREALGAVLDQVGFDPAEAGKIVLAIDEALANVIKHGYGGSCEEPIDIRISSIEEGGRSGIRVSIRDFGQQVEPSTISGRDLEDVRPGGLGVHIMRSVMDEVAYDHADPEGMRVTMTKWVKP